MHKKSLWTMAAIAASGICHGDFVREEWIIHSPKAKWEEVLQKAGISETYVETLLKTHGIFLHAGDVHPNVKQIDPPLPFPAADPTLLWKDEYTSIYYPGNGRVAEHIWVVLNKPKESLTEVNPEEALQMRKTVNRVLQVLRENFHLTNTVIAQWNQIQKGQLPSRFTIEVIPCRLDSNDVHNAWDKMRCNNYVLFRGEYPYLSVPVIVVEKEKEIARWQKALQETDGLIPQKPLSEPVEDWVQIHTNRVPAGKELFDTFYEALLRQGIDIERKVNNEEIDEPNTERIPKRGCAFCNSKVIDYQKVYESKYTYILYNFKPSVPGGHFMIVPKRHSKFSHNLMAEEIQDMHELAKKLTGALYKIFGRKDVKMYIQDGPSVGQTVPHAHMHLLLTPQPVKYMLFSLNYNQEIPVTAEEMQRVTSEMKATLEQL